MKTLLYIENRPHICESFMSLFNEQTAFLKVFSAQSITEAIDIIQSLKIDLVLAGKALNRKELDVLDSHLLNFPETKLVVITSKNSQLSNLLKTLEYNIEINGPVDINLLLGILFKEFDISYGGQIKGISLSSFLQMIELETQTCTLSVFAGKQKGTLYFDGGTLLEAKTGDQNGKDAACEILSWEDPIISIEYTLEEKEQVIRISLMSLLLESGRIIDEKQGDGSEKRRYSRFSCKLPIKFRCEGYTHDGVAINISLGGLFIRTHDNFQLGQKIHFSIFNESLAKTCDFTGTIVRTTKQGFGLAFDALSMNQKNIIRMMIEEYNPN